MEAKTSIKNAYEHYKERSEVIKKTLKINCKPDTLIVKQLPPATKMKILRKNVFQINTITVT